MDVGTFVGLAAVFVLVLANGFFVATEFAIVAVRRSRLEQLEVEGRAGAKAARAVVEHLDSYIAATQFGITLASLALGWLGEPALAHLLEPPLASVLGSAAPTAAHGVAIGVSFALITGLHIVIGELAPKGLALQRPEATSLWVARPIQVFHALFKWPITLLNSIGNGTLGLLGLEPASGHEMVHSVEELRLLVTGMQRAGVVDMAEARIAQRAFVFGELTAAALMTPRTDLQGIPATASKDEALQIAERAGYSRLPVFVGTMDHVVGVVHVRQLFSQRTAPAETFSVQALAQPLLLVPETKDASDLLEGMRHNRCHAAIVVDEYGGTAGMVTLRDLLEALVGRIDDAAAGNAPSGGALLQRDGSMLLDGLLRLDEFQDATGIRLDDDTADGVETIGGLVTSVLGRVPILGDEVPVGGRRLRVEGLHRLRIATVRLLPASAARPR
jgi:putative hemolysin